MENTNFFRNLFRAFLLGTVLYLAFVGFYYLTGDLGADFNWEMAMKEYVQNLFFAIMLYMLNAYWFFFLIKRYSSQLFTIPKMAFAIAGNIVISCIGIFICRLVIVTSSHGKSVAEFLAAENIWQYQRPMLVSLVVCFIFYSIWFYKFRQENKVKEQKIIAGTASAKFDALKNQLDPHFLFNSLNVLTSLIEENPYQAQKFTTSLSKVYRYVLEQKNKDLVSVDEELQFARTYVRLLMMRFEGSIIIDIPEHGSNPEAKIVPLSLQLLLENTVKHNVVSEARPLRLKVYESEGMLVVSNNIQEKEVVKKSTGVGLHNIRQRYAIVSERQVRIEKTDTEFTVWLPILTKMVSRKEIQDEYLEDKRYERAKKKVENIKGFYGNLISFCLVIPFLIMINYNTGGFPWVLFVLFGWGTSVVSHGMKAYGYSPLWGKKWEEEKMRKFMEDDRF